MRKLILLLFIPVILTGCGKSDIEVRTVWSADEAWTWYRRQPWPVGSDFIPSTAINQLEMWQASTFDTATIRRELGWAQSLGMNAMRVYLHHAAWEADPEGFLNRVDAYLNIADDRGISTLFTLFDDCWNPEYANGIQPAPRTGIHNSGWLRDPGDKIHRDTALFTVLEAYTKAVLKRFAEDKRILLWDLYNEPGNSGYRNKSMPLLQKVFVWAREVNPTQPLSVGYWNDDLKEINDFVLRESDVITYHNYSPPDEHKRLIDTLKTLGRPLICTEYMARTRGSLFSNILPILKREGIGAFNWGFVAGKTNTIFAWDTPMPQGGEPPVWFHDILRGDGTPYDTAEVNLIRRLTGKAGG